MEKLRAALAKYRKTYEIYGYPGAPHAFFNDTRAGSYRPGAAADAWAKTLAFFRKHMS